MRQGDPAWGHLQASKWLDCPFLVDVEEMRALMDSLAPILFFMVGSVCPAGGGEVDSRLFIDDYASYVELLKKGEEPNASYYRSRFSLAMTKTSDSVYFVPVGTGKQIIRADQPVVQVQSHHLSYSEVDNKFHSMVFGIDSIPWGLQFSYPQLYKDAATQEVREVKESPEFPNTVLFKSIQKWLRENTVPTPFLVHGQQINVPVRIGKKCMSWIHHHPQLLKKGIKVKV